MVSKFLRYIKLIILAIVSILFSFSVSAASLEWSVTNTVESAHPGDTVFFSGIIINETGETLESTDFFLNFYAFDSLHLMPNQELGLVPFVLPDLTDSGNVPLFNVLIDPSTVPDTYYLSAMLQDINGNLTESLDVAITISAIPEPTAANLLLSGLFTFLLISYYRSFKHKQG